MSNRAFISRNKLEDKRRREEEEATKAVYNEFVEQFSDEGSGSAGSGISFVTGGTVQHGPTSSKTSSAGRSKMYKPSSSGSLLSGSRSGSGGGGGGKSSSSSSSFGSAKRTAEENAKRIMEEANSHRYPGRSSSDRSSSSKSSKKGNDSKKPKSNLEAFKEELKEMQEARAERRQIRRQLQEQLGADKEAVDKIAPSLDNPYASGGSYDQDDPYTTNIFVSNLTSQVNEEDVYEVFGRFGPLASVKVMYPRSEEDRLRGYLCGFVAFMTRTDADRCIFGLRDKGHLLHSDTMRLSWAKGVNIPPNPIYIPQEMLDMSMPPPRSDLPFNAQPNDPDEYDVYVETFGLPTPLEPNPLASKNPDQREAWNKMIRNAVVKVVIPTERMLLGIIHRTIEFVIREGPIFEAMLMNKELNNPTYRFLFDNQTPAHVYYRWRLYSLLVGDKATISEWSTEAFRMFEGGSMWEPPPMEFFQQGMPKSLYHLADFGKSKPKSDDRGRGPGSDSPRRRSRSPRSRSRSRSRSPRGRSRSPFRRSRSPRSRSRSRSRGSPASDRSDSLERKRHAAANIAARLTASQSLSDKERDELEDILRSLVPERRCIRDAMGWCVQKSDSALEIVECIAESLEIVATPLHKKIARLYLISDILSNCGQAKVPNVTYYRKYFGDRFEKIFRDIRDTYDKIQARLKAEQFKNRVMACFRCWEQHSLYPVDFLIQLQNIFLGLAIVADDKEDDDDDEEDGKPLVDDDERDDVDGIPLEQAAAAAAAAGGVGSDKTVRSSVSPKDRSSSPPPKPPASKWETSGFKTSKWETVDPDLVEKQAVTTSRWEMVDGGDDEKEDGRGNAAAGGSSDDGEPMDDDDDGIDGKPLGNKKDDGEIDDNDIDGQPMEQPQRAASFKIGSAPSSSLRQQSASTSVGSTMGGMMDQMSDERRKELRQIEIKVMTYHEDLEEDGLAKNEITTKTQEYRQKLMKKLEAEWEREDRRSSGGSKRDDRFTSSSRRSNGASAADTLSSKHSSSSYDGKGKDEYRKSSSKKKKRSSSKSPPAKKSKHSRRSPSPKHKRRK